MAYSRTRRPPIADAGGGGFHHYYHTTTFDRSAAANSHPDYSRKQPHRDRILFPDADAGLAPPLKRRRWPEAPTWEDDRERNSAAVKPPAEDDAGTAPFMSRDEIERCSPSRKDGIDVLLETHLRYSYCSYLQTLGTRLDLPQTTIGTAMVLCHRFFVRRSHACHDRFLIATAALFLATKTEETPCLLNTVLRASCEICQKQNFSFFPYSVYTQDWFEQYREQVIEAEQMILTTLDFELDVEHPYVPLASVLSKLGLSQTVLLNLAWNLVSEGVFHHENNVLTCMIFLAGGLICCSWKAFFYTSEVELLARYGFNYMKISTLCSTG